MADIFATVPEFLAAFNNILENGFFSDVQLKILGLEGKIYNCSLHISGHVPNDKTYQADGCGVIIDPKTLVETCRNLLDKMKVKKISTKVETQDWPLWDEEGEHIVGRKGQQTQLEMMITFET